MDACVCYTAENSVGEDSLWLESPSLSSLGKPCWPLTSVLGPEHLLQSKGCG